ncbi:hypothetical protein D0Z00_002864 [Geotrichum galactomycetum]|uniref:Uncharacterized protein n=1 Tax=Geotrichum galactomycetum TaxID=27317 RepID=A0ACB6V2X6_9ASCO|nr:hypothetical protein D0Z00_002864 [Geotrichum candidum]
MSASATPAPAVNGTPALKTNPKYIVFTDWDGTVTLQDSNDHMTHNLGFGYDKRIALNDRILDGSLSFRDGFQQMLDSIHTPFPECIDYLLKEIQLDPGFADFYKWAKANNIPIVIVSSGMKPIIHALLVKLVGKAAADDIEIISNDVIIKEDGSWDIVFRDESDFGHDKSRCIRPYTATATRPTLFYCGDGVSDLSAARETDLLFAKEGKDLITYCKRENIPYTTFASFKDIHTKIQDIVEGKKTVQQSQDN